MRDTVRDELQHGEILARRHIDHLQHIALLEEADLIPCPDLAILRCAIVTRVFSLRHESTVVPWEIAVTAIGHCEVEKIGGYDVQCLSGMGRRLH
jgi:hypothetical protein